MKKIARGLVGLVLMFAVSFAALCDGVSKFDRVIAAVDAAPMLVATFNISAEDKAEWNRRFGAVSSAMRAYKESQTGDKWQAFLNAFAAVGDSGIIKDETARARVNAIVAFVRVILGVPAPQPGLRMGTPPQPNLKKITDSDVKKLEDLMKPLPPH